MNEVGASASPFLKILALRWLKIADASQKLATISKNYQRYEQRMVIYKTTEKPKHTKFQCVTETNCRPGSPSFYEFPVVRLATVEWRGGPWSPGRRRISQRKAYPWWKLFHSKKKRGKNVTIEGINSREQSLAFRMRSKPWPWPSCSFAEEFPGSSLRSIVNARRLIHDASFPLRA